MLEEITYEPSSILKLGDPRLRTPCAAVTDFNAIQGTVERLRATLAGLDNTLTFERGSGLAAPQIGELFRVAIVRWQGNTFDLINPVLTFKSSENIVVKEGCLSFFDYRANVTRHKRVEVTAQDRHGKDFVLKGDNDDLSALIQHELDHLDGILTIDRLPNGEAELMRVEGMPSVP